jgi:hypothetical protein
MSTIAIPLNVREQLRLTVEGAFVTIKRNITEPSSGCEKPPGKISIIWRDESSVGATSTPASLMATRQRRDSKGRNAKLRRASKNRALLLLERLPITARGLPQIRIEHRNTIGAVVVYDRLDEQRYILYTPSRQAEFVSGHIYGRWYIRAIEKECVRPMSLAFDSWRLALEAVRCACWTMRARCAT